MPVYSVALKGYGRPDYEPESQVSKPVLTTGQEHWSDVWTTADDYGGQLPVGSLTITAYTVPTGYRLHIGGGVFTCEGSCIQNVELVCVTGILGDFRYDMRGVFDFAGDAAHILEEGDVLQYILTNDDIVARHFSISLYGTLERVS